MGKELGARRLVLGSYQRAGERLRILPRVIDVATGEEVATAKIDGGWEDVFDCVVTNVMTALEVKIDPCPAPFDLSLTLRGLFAAFA